MGIKKGRFLEKFKKNRKRRILQMCSLSLLRERGRVRVSIKNY
jgi:hypothetical protein